MPKYRQFFLMNCVKESGGHMSTLNIDFFGNQQSVCNSGWKRGLFQKKSYFSLVRD